MTSRNDNLKSPITYEQLLANEKMAELGRHVADISHELASPISAIKAADSNIGNLFKDILTSLPTVVSRLSKKELEIFFSLIDHALLNPSIFSNKEERKNRKTLTESLQEKGIANAAEHADTLVDMGMLTNIEDTLPLLNRSDSKIILKSAHDVVVLNSNYVIIRTAINRLSKFVSALKDYSYHQHDAHMQKENLVESLDTILILYTHKLKKGIEVKKNYNHVPHIMCYPDELQQVWTNLIENAIQAMSHNGTLTLRVYQIKSYVVVEIGDTGPGMSPDIQEKIFEPFFTTKERGEGSGLGLDIVKAIIERHDGEITVTSKPGDTVFCVKLPIIQMTSAADK